MARKVLWEGARKSPNEVIHTPHRRFTVAVTPEPSAVGRQPPHEPV